MKRSSPVVSRSSPTTSPGGPAPTTSSVGAGYDRTADTSPAAEPSSCGRVATVIAMTGRPRVRRWHGPVVSAAALALLGALSATAAGPPLPASGASPPSTAGTDPAALVHPLDGTATGPVSPGTVGEFPGADLPFGMIQWSPDTSPNEAQAGGGYAYDDSAISGFSLTHLSGTGCPSYQDVPILPTVGAVTSPATAVATFSHQTGACRARPLSGRARGPGSHLGLPGRHHTVGHLELRLPARHRVQRALQGGRQRQPGHGGQRAGGRSQRGRGPGDQRAVLWDRIQLHAALRRPLRPAVLGGGDVERFGHGPRSRRLQRDVLWCFRHLRHDASSSRF